MDKGVITEKPVSKLSFKIKYGFMLQGYLHFLNCGERLAASYVLVLIPAWSTCSPQHTVLKRPSLAVRFQDYYPYRRQNLSYVYFAVYVFRNQMRRQRSPD
jgi:hypothetical protein